MHGDRITVLDIGHGNCAVLEAGGCTVVIDAGPKGYVLNYLEQRNINSIDTVLLSHADQDHVGGLLSILSSHVRVDKIRLNTDSLKPSRVWEDLLYELNSQDGKGEIDFSVSLTANMMEDYSCGDARVEVLGPSKYLAAKGPGAKDSKGRNITTNSISAVVRVSNKHEGIVLLAADLDNIALEDLQREKVDLTANVLIFPHHGGATKPKSFIPTLLEMVNPKKILFSIGREKFENPNKAVVSEIREILPEVHIMCTQLSKNCSTEIPTVSPEYMRSLYAQGAENKRCCAATMLIDIDSGDLLNPVDVDHAKFVNDVVESPLCRR